MPSCYTPPVHGYLLVSFYSIHRGIVKGHSMPISSMIHEKKRCGDVTIEITIWDASPAQQEKVIPEIENCFSRLLSLVQAHPSGQDVSSVEKSSDEIA